MAVWGCVWMSTCHGTLCGPQRITVLSLCFPSALWVPGLDLRSSALTSSLYKEENEDLEKLDNLISILWFLLPSDTPSACVIVTSALGIRTQNELDSQTVYFSGQCHWASHLLLEDLSC